MVAVKTRNHQINRWRARGGELGSDNSYGNNGAFHIPCPETGSTLFVVASDGMGWDHVSVSVVDEERCPAWEEMCYVKQLFWHEDETVIQYHPAESDYVRCHPWALHMWRPQHAELPKPLPVMVGVSS